MNEFNQRTVGVTAPTDAGLRSFMLGTYRYMMMAMGVTGLVAYFFGQYMLGNPGVANMLFNPIVLIGFVIAIPVAFGAIGRKLPSMSLGGVLAFLFIFAAVMGVFTSVIGLMYDPRIVAKIFFMTVAMFGALSLFGYTTERNLSTFVKYAFAAFLGYVVISVLGAVFPALQINDGSTLGIIINVVALAAIAMITAWETQMLKRTYYAVAGDARMEGKMAAFGAASLLLAFINMFQILLSLFGRD